MPALKTRLLSLQTQHCGRGNRYKETLSIVSKCETYSHFCIFAGVMERTFVIVKPCSLQRGIVGEIITRFERKGLKIVALKMYRFSKEKCAEHYQHLVDKPFYPIIEKSMMAAPVLLLCLEGIDAVAVVREMTGSTNGRKAAPGTLRGDFCMSHQENVVHASDSLENAAKELARFFTEEDYFEYTQANFPYLYAEDELS